MDSCFHFGFNSKCNITRFDTISYINSELHNIELKNVDLILLGCQSNTVPVDNGNLNNFPIAQTEFLFATQPDIVILSINVWDDLEYINNTINFIKACSNANVVALVAYPFDLIIDESDNSYKTVPLTNERFELAKEQLSSLLLPIYRLNDQTGMDKLYDSILKMLYEE